MVDLQKVTQQILRIRKGRIAQVKIVVVIVLRFIFNFNFFIFFKDFQSGDQIWTMLTNTTQKPMLAITHSGSK
jgi:hypothetical protein